MSSLKCGICGKGLHLHGEPNGIEYIFFAAESWQQLLAQNPVSDLVELDFPGTFRKLWKCPDCRSLMFFGADEATVVSTYRLTAEPVDDDGEAHIFFAYSDRTWDELTERGLDMQTTATLIPPLRASVTGDYLAIYQDNKKIATYRREC